MLQTCKKFLHSCYWPCSLTYIGVLAPKVVHIFLKCCVCFIFNGPTLYTFSLNTFFRWWLPKRRHFLQTSLKKVNFVLANQTRRELGRLLHLADFSCFSLNHMFPLLHQQTHTWVLFPYSPDTFMASKYGCYTFLQSIPDMQPYKWMKTSNISLLFASRGLWTKVL